MKYKILSAYDTDEMEYLVEDEIKEGWEPYGSLAIKHGESENEGNYIVFYQPMIKINATRLMTEAEINDVADFERVQRSAHGL